MSVFKYRAELLDAMRDVESPETETDWAVFEYEGSTDNLKYVAKGAEGVEELCEFFTRFRVMYGYVKLRTRETENSISLNETHDPLVLIVWLGGASRTKETKCAAQLSDVRRFFKRARGTIKAHTLEELDERRLREKILNSDPVLTPQRNSIYNQDSGQFWLRAYQK